MCSQVRVSELAALPTVKSGELLQMTDQPKKSENEDFLVFVCALLFETGYMRIYSYLLKGPTTQRLHVRKSRAGKKGWIQGNIPEISVRM